MLRRLKSDPTIIDDLPEKIEIKTYCNLTKEQATLYKAVVKDMLNEIDEESGIKRKGLVLAALTRLKQVCNHPAHFLDDGSVLEKRSGKLNRLTEMLEELISEGHVALIFTQFAKMGEMLKKSLQNVLGQEILFLHGGVPQKVRDRMIMRFSEKRGPKIFILSLKAGGLGLNLTRASHVFHFDRWWNPAVENQATDRAFRIGQTKNVMVYKFICEGTLEEKIDELIESKKELAESIIGTGESWLTEMTTDQLRDLFTLKRVEVLNE
jgi:SNF2 family DNA or RNA helicase